MAADVNVTDQLLDSSIFFFKQKTAYEIYQCDWSSDVCSSDLFKSWLYGRRFTLYTDHRALVYLFTGTHSNYMLEQIGRASCRERV